jgi:hypothetical protein
MRSLHGWCEQIVVAASLTTGDYSVTIHGTVTGFIDRNATITVTAQQARHRSKESN